MFDFLKIGEKNTRDGKEIYPKFQVCHSKDLMIKGNRFHAIWDEDAKLWSMDDQRAIDLIDRELDIYAQKYQDTGIPYYIKHVRDADSGSCDKWRKFCSRQMYSYWHELDYNLTFANQETTREDYASKRLKYPLEAGSTESWDRILSVLYSPEERMKIEWAIGAIVHGDSKKIQKFMVLYGDRGTGKSTVMDIMELLFEGYCVPFDAKILASASASFPLEPFKNNPLVAIQHDGDLSRIEDNTRLNSLVSHEIMSVNLKHEPMYGARFRAFLVMGTNKPVKITDAKSGLLRRLIDVTPTGKLLSSREYKKLKKAVEFELGAIAYKCLDIYKNNVGYYDEYLPIRMMNITNTFYNFLTSDDVYDTFKQNDSTTLSAAWKLYCDWIKKANIERGMNYMSFKDELANYFREYRERDRLPDGTQVRKKYVGFIIDDMKKKVVEEANTITDWLNLSVQTSKLDILWKDRPAQYATNDEKPSQAWDNVKTTLNDIQTDMLHYVRPEEHQIVIDFDIRDGNGVKSLELNKQAASAFPPTYAETSKSGGGLHLHYYYSGDVSKLRMLYAPGVEIKVFTGKSSLRRKLIKCNNLDILTINSGLPLKENNKMVKKNDSIKSEKDLRRVIEMNLQKKIIPFTSPSISLIFQDLQNAYDSGMVYDVSDMKPAIEEFAKGSHNQKDRCLKLVSKMRFNSSDDITTDTDVYLVVKDLRFKIEQLLNCPYEEDIKTNLEKIKEIFDILYKMDFEYDFSDMANAIWGLAAYSSECMAIAGSIHFKKVKDNSIDISSDAPSVEKPKIIWDVESYCNFFGMCYKQIGNYPVIKLKRPKPEVIEDLKEKYDWIGFNCRKYDNHMTYAASMGYSDEQLNKLSNNIINNKANSTFSEAWDWSFTDIYDYAKTKQSLKKWEIELKKKNPELDFGHMEMDIPWDQPLPDDRIDDLMEYCANDVLATEAVWNATQDDFKAREILADISEGKVNDTTNSLTTKFIFGSNKHPQDEFNYYFMGIEKGEDTSKWLKNFPSLDCDLEYTVFDDQGRARFPGYEYKYDKEQQRYISTYRGEEVGEGGYVYSEPGMYNNVKTFDVAGMHPSTLIVTNYFGDAGTKRYKDIYDIRIFIKHGDFDSPKKMFNGKLAKYLDDKNSAKALSAALKLAINSVYGLTCAGFENPFRDPRNIDNFIAKRGALFMINLKHEVQNRGFRVVHIKTDSIKIENPTPEIEQFISDYGKLYGYTFEVESDYQKICLVNDAVYIAKAKKPEIDKDTGEEIWWSATGKQFAVPYVFKTLFSKQPITYYDVCETFNVQTSLYLDINATLPDVSQYEAELKKLKKSDNIDVSRVKFLETEIAKGHDYKFVGRVGLFTPVTKGGGILLRKNKNDDGYSAVAGTKGYRWLDAEQARKFIDNGLTEIDLSYYYRLADEAVETISKFGDFNEFAS